MLGRDTEPKEKQDGEYSRQDLKSKGRIELGLQQLLKLTSWLDQLARDCCILFMPGTWEDNIDVDSAYFILLHKVLKPDSVWTLWKCFWMAYTFFATFKHLMTLWDLYTHQPKPGSLFCFVSVQCFHWNNYIASHFTFCNLRNGFGSIFLKMRGEYQGTKDLVWEMGKKEERALVTERRGR